MNPWLALWLVVMVAAVIALVVGAVIDRRHRSQPDPIDHTNTAEEAS